MERLFHDRIEQLREAERLGEAYGIPLPDQPDALGSSTSSLLAVSVTQTGPTAAGGAGAGTPAPAEGGGRRRRLELTAAMLAVAALLVGAIVFLAPRRVPTDGSAAPPTEPRNVEVIDPGEPAPERSRRPATPPPATPARATPSRTAREPSAPSAPTTPALPAKIAVELETSPPSAEVYIGEALVGVTPTTIRIERGKKPVKLTFRLAGYKELTQTLVPVEDARVVRSLSALPKKPAARRKRADEDLLDPFK
jgi:hypothetical protein